MTGGVLNLEMPKNIEEAKEIARISTNCALNTRFLNKYKRKAAIIALVGIAAGVITGIITGDFIMLFGISANMLLIAFSALFPYYGRKKVIKSIQNGKFFERHTEYEIMKYARLFVLENDAFERTGKLYNEFDRAVL